ncbi:holo-ACP synthase [Aliidiomarina sp. Khilg15.8]
MAIVGIGTDIVSIARIEKALSRNSEFAERVLTPAEMQEFAAAPKPAAFLAKRFAAKEAAAKALGTGIGEVSFQHIYVDHTAAGQPLLRLFDNADAQAGILGARSFHISISDEREFAIAYVVLESN